MLTNEEIESCEEVAAKNKAVAKLLEEYHIMMQSPAVDTYLSVLSFVNTINKQLTFAAQDDAFNAFLSDEGVEEKKKSGGISDAQDKFWDRGTKFALECDKIHAALESLRARMNPEQQEAVDKKRKQKPGDENKVVI